MALLEESGQVIQQPEVAGSDSFTADATHGHFIGVLPAYTELQGIERPGVMLPVVAGKIPLGERVVGGGIILSNTDTVVDRSGFQLPGYALRKTARVITLVDQTRVAVGAVIQ